jgi:outer membrane protein assembly factor BamD (BamD/ComL family)
VPTVVVEALPSAAPSAAPVHGHAQAPVDDIKGQIALIDAARTALSTGAANRALEVLGQYQARYPAGSFRPEATALRIEALAKLGRNAEARALGERFIAEHHGSPLADRVAREIGVSSP